MAGLTAAELEAVVGVNDDMFEKGLDSMLGKFEAWGGQAGKIMAGIGAVGGGLFAAGLAGGLSLDAARGRLQAELGLTEKESARLGKIAGSLYADGYGESIGDVTDAIGTVVSSIKGMRDASDAQLSAMTQRAMNFSDVFDVDITRAVEVAGVAMKSGLVKNGKQAFDLLTVTMQKVPKAVREDVLDATEEYSQFFSAIGIKGPAAFALLAKGAAKGMYGIDKTGDAIKEFTIRSTDMSTTTRQAYKVLGLDTKKMTNQLLAGGDSAKKAFHKIIDGLLSVKSPAKQSQAALALFGTPLEDLGTKDIPKFLSSLDASGKSLGKVEGAADRAGAALRDNAGANLTKFTRGLKSGFTQVVGGTVVPMLNKATAAIGGFGTFLANHSVVAKGILVGLGAAFALFGVAATVNAAKSVAAWVATALAAQTSGEAQALTAGQLAVKWAVLGAKSLLNAAKMAAAWLIAMGPIALVIAAVVGLVALIIANWDKVKAVTVAVWNAVVGAIVGVWKKIKGAVSAAVSAVIGFIKAHWPLILGILTGPFGLAVGLIIKYWDQIKHAVSTAIDKVIGFVKTIPGRIKSALSNLGHIIGGIFRDAWNGALDIARDLGGKVVDWIRGIPGKLRDLGGLFASAGRAILQAFVDGMKHAAGIITGIAGNVWNAVKGLLNGAIGRINAALEFTIGLPGPDIHINPPDIPYLASGGRATGPTLAMIGEGAEPETVLPDSVLRGLLTRARDAGIAAGRGAAKGVGDALSLDDLLDEVARLGDRIVGALEQQTWDETMNARAV